MVLKILLIISILLQVIAAAIAIKLTRITKYNFSWMLFTIAFVAMCLLRLAEFLNVVDKGVFLSDKFVVWMGVLTSFCFAVGLFYVKKIFNYIDRLNFQRKLTERRILTTVLRTEEKERLRFSKELHDGLGPLLSSAKMSLSAISKENLSGPDCEIINNTGYVIEEAIRSLREISNNLSPHTLNDFGLSRALSSFISKSVNLNNTKIRFSTNLRSERFDTDIEVILYRVICELINNSIKHSGCTDIDLKISYHDEIIKVEYTDNGKGFDPDAVMDIGMGMSNITSRINSLKGTANFSSSKDQGMKAEIIVNSAGKWKKQNIK